ncbi:MAG: ABC transporter ATP-binding protein, partial [Patescibacteria group bacterium]
MTETEQHIPIHLILKKLWDGVRPYQWQFWSSFIFLIIALTVNIFVPLWYKDFFDILGKASKEVSSGQSLIHILYIVGLLHTINWLFFRLAIFLFNGMETKVMAQLKQNAFNYMMLHSYVFFTNNFTGSLVQRVGRFSRAFERLSDTFFFSIIPLFVTVIGSTIIIWQQAPAISVVIIFWVIIISTFHILFSRWKLKYDLKMVAADSLTTGMLSDSISNHNSVRLFTGFAHEKKSFKDVTDDQARKTLFSWRLGDLVDTVQVFLIYVVEFLIFYYAVIFWQKGAITLGTFVLIQAYIIGIASQLWSLSKIIRNIYESFADSKEMVEILITPYGIKNVAEAKPLLVDKGEITFDDVSFAFNNQKNVLSHINLSIKPGEKIALVGPSGAGKTTLVQLILRIYDVTSGSVSIDSHDISKVTQESLRKNISLVPQDPVLFHRTLLENIRYGDRDATNNEVIRVAKLAHCDEFIEHLSLKYDTYVGERGVKLSGGERQRVAIARAILKNAPILIFDEATSSLDSHSEALIQDALDVLMRGRTTVVIAHRLSTIRKMDRIIVLKDGAIA